MHRGMLPPAQNAEAFAIAVADPEGFPRFPLKPPFELV